MNLLSSKSEMKGSYILVLRVPHPTYVPVGRLGKVSFREGFYAYVGSGMRGVQARIKRHLRRNKKKRWHIDYLLDHSDLMDIIIIESDKKIECALATFLFKEYEVVKNFGSSDCRCPGHLFYLGTTKRGLGKTVKAMVSCINPTREEEICKKPLNSKIRGVLFDLDGTLTVPGALDFPAIKREMGCPLEIPILEYIESRPPHQRSKLYAILEKHEAQAAKNSIPHEDAEQCLESLKAKGIRLGIITRNRISSVEKVLLKFRYTTKEDFSAIITRDDTLPKPHPQGVELAAKRMGVSPQELLVVGDFRFDIIAGKAAGAKTAFLRNKLPVENPEFQPMADLELNNLLELLYYLP